MQKVYSRINWENGELGDTPLNEANLNRMDNAINEIDNRVVEFDTSKLSVTDSQNLIADWQMDETTGIITVTRKNGDKIIFDLNVEKIPASFSLSDDGILTMMTADGTIFTANIGAMIPVLTFNSTDTIGVTVTGEGANKTYSFNVLDGSITDDKIESGYLAKVKLNAGNAATSEEYAGLYANKSEAWAVGQKNGENVPSTDETYHNNAKYWAEQAKTATNVGNGTLTIKQGDTVKGTFSANQSENNEIVVSDNATDIKMTNTQYGSNVEEAIGYVAKNAGAKYAYEIATNSGKTVQTEIDTLNQNLEASINYVTGGEEVLIGKLGDDDLYRRVYIYDGPATTSNITFDKNFNYECVKYVKELNVVFQINGTGWCPYCWESSSVKIRPQIDNVGYGLLVQVGTWSVTKAVLIVEYTKP